MLREQIQDYIHVHAAAHLLCRSWKKSTRTKVLYESDFQNASEEMIQGKISRGRVGSHAIGVFILYMKELDKSR